MSRALATILRVMIALSVSAALEAQYDTFVHRASPAGAPARALPSAEVTGGATLGRCGHSPGFPGRTPV